MDTTKRYQVQCNGNAVDSASSEEEAESLLAKLRDENTEQLIAQNSLPKSVIDDIAATGWKVFDQGDAPPPPAPSPEPTPEPEPEPAPSDPSDDV
jgi:hypothetical protein